MKRLILRLVLAGVILAGGVAGVLHFRSAGSGGDENVAQAAEAGSPSPKAAPPSTGQSENQRPQPITDPQGDASPNTGDGFQRVEVPSSEVSSSRTFPDSENSELAQPPAQPQVVSPTRSDPASSDPASYSRYGSGSSSGEDFDRNESPTRPPAQPSVAVAYDETSLPTQPSSRYSIDDDNGGDREESVEKTETAEETGSSAPQSAAAYDPSAYAPSAYGSQENGVNETAAQPTTLPGYGSPYGSEPSDHAASGDDSNSDDSGAVQPADEEAERREPDGALAQPQPIRFTDQEVAPVENVRSEEPLKGYAPADGSANPGSPLADSEASLATDVPGERRLEGTQAPSLSIEKKLPPEIQVGKPAVLEIHVRNTGSTPAHGVSVVDRVPQGTRLTDLAPQAAQTPDGALLWSLGTLDPGEQKTLKMELMPEVEGEIGSIAQVVFHAQASARTVCTRPELVVEQSASPKVLIGQNTTVTILITNRGTGAAANVVLEEDVPPQFSHPAGKELENEIGVIRPGETRRLNLTLTAVKAGPVRNEILVRGEGSVSATSSLDLEVIAPELELSLQGPTRRYLQRQVTFELAAANPGTAIAKDVRLVAYLPKGLTFVSSNKGGQYESQRHAVLWSVDELSPSQSDTVQWTAIPVETGEQKIRVEGTGDLGLEQTHEHRMVVESVAELHFTMLDKADPIEVGSETIYEITVVNDGSKPDSNVQVAAEFPEGLKPLEGEGPTRGVVQGDTVLFEPLPRLDPKDKAVYRIRVEGTQDGDQRVRVQIASDEAPTPVTKEEITRVYSDR